MYKTCCIRYLWTQEDHVHVKAIHSHKLSTSAWKKRSRQLQMMGNTIWIDVSFPTGMLCFQLSFYCFTTHPHFFLIPQPLPVVHDITWMQFNISYTCLHMISTFTLQISSTTGRRRDLLVKTDFSTLLQVLLSHTITRHSTLFHSILSYQTENRLTQSQKKHTKVPPDKVHDNRIQMTSDTKIKVLLS